MTQRPDGKAAGPKKYKSGAQKRRERAEREAAQKAEFVAQAQEYGFRVNDDPDAPEATFDSSWANDFQEAGEPDLENPDTDLDYVRKLQLIVLRQMATTANPPKPQQDAWRRIREMSAVVGMTSNRAKLESEVRHLKGLLQRRQERGTAMSTGAGAGVQRSPGARGQRRGPRPVPDEPPNDGQ